MFDNTSIGTLRKEVRSYELILNLRKFLPWILCLCAVVFAATYWYAGRHLPYQSKILVDVSSAPVFLSMQENNKQPVEIFRNSEYVMRVLQFVHSNRMIDHLQERFNLYQHYHIPPDAPYANERLYNVATSRIQVKKSPFENVVITVTDWDKDFAASLANEVGAETETLARAYFTQAMTGKLAYYQELLKNLRADFDGKLNNVDTTLKKMSDLRQSSGSSESKARLSEAENTMLTSVSRMTGIVEQAADLQKNQAWIISMLNNKQFRFITVTQRAMADQSNLTIKRIMFATAAAVGTGLMTILLTYLAMTYRRYFQLFFLRRVN